MAEPAVAAGDALRQALLAGERAAERYALMVPPATAAGAAGLFLGRRSGSSLEFREHRDYQPGDDLRHIDWHAYARSDLLTVKLYREEVTPHVDLVVDASRSMALPGSAKAAATVGLAALLARAATQAGYHYRLWQAAAECTPLAGGGTTPGRWPPLALDGEASPAPALARRAGGWRPQGVRLLVSDLLWPEEPRAVLQALARQAAAVVVVQVLARADVEPAAGVPAAGVPAAGEHVRLEDSETGQLRELRLDEDAVASYHQALARHQESWRRACREAAAVLVTVVAEELVATWRPEPLLAAEVLRAL